MHETENVSLGLRPVPCYVTVPGLGGRCAGHSSYSVTASVWYWAAQRRTQRKSECSQANSGCSDSMVSESWEMAQWMMAQWVKVSVTRPDGPSSIPRTHMVEGRTDS